MGRVQRPKPDSASSGPRGPTRVEGERRLTCSNVDLSLCRLQNAASLHVLNFDLSTPRAVLARITSTAANSVAQTWTRMVSVPPLCAAQRSDGTANVLARANLHDANPKTPRRGAPGAPPVPWQPRCVVVSVWPAAACSLESQPLRSGVARAVGLEVPAVIVVVRCVAETSQPERVK